MINTLLPFYLKALSPLLNDLEHARNKPAVICIGEREYSYPQMAKLIRDVAPEGVEYAMDWLEADIKLREELLNS